MADLECPPIWEAENTDLSTTVSCLKGRLTVLNGIVKSHNLVMNKINCIQEHLYKLQNRVNLLFKSLDSVILLGRSGGQTLVSKVLWRCWKLSCYCTGELLYGDWWQFIELYTMTCVFLLYYDKKIQETGKGESRGRGSQLYQSLPWHCFYLIIIPFIHQRQFQWTGVLCPLITPFKSTLHYFYKIVSNWNLCKLFEIM